MTIYDIGYIIILMITPQGKKEVFLMVFSNLSAELARHSIKNSDFAKLLGITPRTLTNKLNGVTEFTLSEIKKAAKVFPNVSIDYLFEENTKTA